MTGPSKRAFHKTSGRPVPQDWTDWVKSVCDGVGEASGPSEDPDPHTPILH